MRFVSKVGLVLVAASVLSACGSGSDGRDGQDGRDGNDGARGAPSLIEQSDQPPGEQCPQGGIRIDSGVDTNANGILETEEMTETSYVCHGAVGVPGGDGENGQDGAPGHNALVSLNDEPAGSNCATGGVRIDTGLDANRDGVLHSSEVTETRYVCDGEEGADGQSPPARPTLSVDMAATKQFVFSWPDVERETEYRLLEDRDGQSGYTQVASLPANATEYSHTVFLPKRVNARYLLEACNSVDCVSSEVLHTGGQLTEAIGYFKASNTGGEDVFGFTVSLSADGDTLAVGAGGEDSNATGVDGDQSDNSAEYSGAVYVFTRTGGDWSQQAYLKASNTEYGDVFGVAVSLSADGDTLAVGAPLEDSNTTGPNGDQGDNTATDSGAAYVFSRTDGIWSQQAYLKASNTEAYDEFGSAVSLSDDGNTLAVGAEWEASNAMGVNGDQSDNSAEVSGAVYVFSRTGGNWFQQAYLKASNAGEGDRFGASVSLSADGDTLAVGANREASNATGVDGDQGDNSASNSGAVYVFTRVGGNWAQQAYLKASNTGVNDLFGRAISLSADGVTLAVGAPIEDSNATGINGDQSDNSAEYSGAVYVFTRTGGAWAQQAYLKASNTEMDDWFGGAVSLSADGNTLAVGADGEGSNATGINGDQSDNSAQESGAVYVFTRTGGSWVQQAYLKASNTEAHDGFGSAVSLSADGDTLAVGAPVEYSNATGINGDQSDNSAILSGAVYLY